MSFSSASPVIVVDHLTKEYVLGTRTRGYTTLREAAVSAVTAPLRRVHRLARGGSHAESRPFRALDDVSFSIASGSVVGIVGRNGAGKSTLLRALSRITEPTSGTIAIRGRVASLLEVGTGFHPELTGRENVYLNGSLLGMRRSEISRKFDEIVAFSEIEAFLDTPVKRYSSGMYIRLAFAVAAHLESEILLVDEVLAVGDASFQKKCIGKMGDVARTGKTVLFVSHNMQAVSMLCSRAMLFRSGDLCFDDHAKEVVRTYLVVRSDQLAEVSWARDVAPGGQVVRLRSVRVLAENGEPRFDHDITAPIDIEMEMWVFQPGGVIDASIVVLTEEGLCLFAVGTALVGRGNGRTTEPGLYRTTCHIPANFLNGGPHHVSVNIVRNSSDIVSYANEVVTFVIHDYGTSRDGFMGKIN